MKFYRDCGRNSIKSLSKSRQVSDPDSKSAARGIREFLVRLALFAALGTLIVATGLPLSAESSVGKWPQNLFELLFIWGQSLAMTVPGIVGALALVRRPGAGRLTLAILLVLTLPLLMLANQFSFQWIGQPLFSPATWEVVATHRKSLWAYISAGVMLNALVYSVGFLGFALLACGMAIRLTYHKSLVLLTGIITLGSALTFWFHGEIFEKQIALRPSRHPFAIAGWNLQKGLHSKHPPSSANSELPNEARLNEPRIDFVALAQVIRQKEQSQRFAGLDWQQLDQQKTVAFPDVLLVVIESLRPEAITSAVMPNLTEFANRGIYCRNHFSASNATNTAFFSLVNGLEAIWFRRAIRFSPLLNRLFHEAGYELGFFGASEDWQNFYMDGFISSEQYEVFESEPRRGLNSDRRAIARANEFLSIANRKQTEAGKPVPRLAVVYLYSTHAPHASDPMDQKNQPAAPDHYPIPYPTSLRDQVCNRYLNSARSVDRILADLLDPQRVTIIVGDHGESFLEDGCQGHGIRISRVQNRTPAVVYWPGCEPKSIDAPTMHADVLPTLASACRLPLNDYVQLDGIDLATASLEMLKQRTFLTSNYLEPDQAIIGAWTDSKDGPFAYRCLFSMAGASGEVDASGNVLPPIDAAGRPLEIEPGRPENCWRSPAVVAWHQWLVQRFGAHFIGAGQKPVEGQN